MKMCMPGYMCLKCPYPDCIKGNIVPTKEEVAMAKPWNESQRGRKKKCQKKLKELQSSK